MHQAQYIIGIDLGTTNCTMAYTQSQNEDTQNEGNRDSEAIQQFLIPQWISLDSQEALPSFPSFIYFPLTEEKLKQEALKTQLGSSAYCLGVFARERGAELPSRLISSAKSWLCHTGINRREKLLPQNAEEEEQAQTTEQSNTLVKISPLEACATFLKHLKEAWNHQMPQAAFDEQQILVTLPASFDPSARQLVQEAATLAGYPDIITLEEPQAAFYCWLMKHQKEWRQVLKPGETVLVVDSGGGTTDFSLISIEDEKGDVVIKRLAVGSHLLLGGDNIDLALAYLAKEQFEKQGHQLTDWQFQSLIPTSRHIKEIVLQENPPQTVNVVVMGRGSRLIGGSLKISIESQEIVKFILDGFIPLTTVEERTLNTKKAGLQQIGLPYAQDARLSCQLAKFLSMTGESDEKGLEKFILPNFILFNGGTLKAAALRERFITVLNNWAQELKKPAVEVLAQPDYDYGVSRGAVAYGLARNGKAMRIKSGTSRSYFVGIEEARLAVPGIPASLKAICIVPFGMEEGTEEKLEDQEFALVVGQPATFRFFSHATPHLANGLKPKIGTLVKNWQTELTELHPIETCLDQEEQGEKVVAVHLKSKVTELGVLELWCEALDKRQWKLEFDTR